MSDWEQRYQEGDVQWDKGEPSPGLVDWLAENDDHPTNWEGRIDEVALFDRALTNKEVESMSLD
jgi:hypothetical protein